MFLICPETDPSKKMIPCIIFWPTNWCRVDWAVFTQIALSDYSSYFLCASSVLQEGLAPAGCISQAPRSGFWMGLTVKTLLGDWSMKKGDASALWLLLHCRRSWWRSLPVMPAPSSGPGHQGPSLPTWALWSEVSNSPYTSGGLSVPSWLESSMCTRSCNDSSSLSPWHVDNIYFIDVVPYVGLCFVFLFVLQFCTIRSHTT